MVQYLKEAGYKPGSISRLTKAAPLKNVPQVKKTRSGYRTHASWSDRDVREIAKIVKHNTI